MNSFDYILITLVILLSIKGYTNGFKNELLNLLGIIAGVYLSSLFAPKLASLLNDKVLHLQNTDLLKTALFLLLFAILWAISSQIKILFGDNNYDFTRASSLNNLAGAIVNIIKNLAILSVVIALLGANQKLHSGYIKTIKSSASYKPLLSIGKNIILLDKNQDK